ncbi:MAG: glucosamine-6-phosphate deaminase [Patescibacteria group bacterium]
MNIIIVKDYQTLSEKAANIFLNQLAFKSDSVFGLATGSTPLGLYAEIVKRVREYSYDFSRAAAFNLDEYVSLDSTHPQSYHYFMVKNLFKYLNVNPKNIFFPDGRAKNLIAQSASYEKEISRRPIDLQILGIGQNGHIGFNEPGSDQHSTTCAVDLSEQTVKDNARFFSNEQAVPRQAITMGIGTILKAKKIVILASGENKARAVKQMIETKPSANCPASWLQLHPNATVILDSAAASLLKEKKETKKNGASEIQVLNEKILPKNKKILVISPHHDDSAVSSGATLSALSKNNAVTIAIMSAGFRATIDNLTKEQKIALREREAMEESKTLNCQMIFNYSRFYENGKKFWQDDLQQFKKLWQKIKPDIVILPDRQDEHPTHALSTQLVLDFLKKEKIKQVELWFYEGLWSQHLLPNINLVFGFDKYLLAVKNKAIGKHKSQTTRLPLAGASEALARFRALTLPEQRFVTFGAEPPKIADFVEAYYREIL